MTALNFQRSLKAVLRHEAGYVDHPKDPGGATNRGITQKTLAAWRGRSVTKQDVKGLTEEEAAAIYKKQYWDAVRGDDLPQGLDYAMFDYAVNSGAAKAIRDLQAVLGVRADGQLGLITLDHAVTFGVKQSVEGLSNRRLAFMKTLKTWAVFGKGWTNRVSEVRTLALRMSANSLLPTERMSVAQGKAATSDVRLTRTVEGKAAAAAGTGAAGAGVMELVEKLSPLSESSLVIKYAMTGLCVLGAALLFIALLRRYRNGDLV